jgi:ATP-dependent DNA helicase RecG
MTKSKIIVGQKDPKEYMSLAVDVMKKSISERKKNEPSPYVGAVLVLPDGSTETAYRGEYREGDHAEYTVLDKKNRHRDVSGSWLFATLEPCAPGARNAPKVSCAERIVNARISDVWFGIEDKNPKIDHGGIDYLVENGIKVHQFSPEFHKEIEDLNKKFTKWAHMKNSEAKQVKNKSEDHLDERTATANMNSLSDEALRKFMSESKREYEPRSEEFLLELKEMDLLEYDSNIKKFLPTGNAILLFGKSPRNKFPQAGIKAKVHYADGKTDTETFDDALVLLPDEVESWLKKVLPASIDRTKFKAKHVPSFPIPVIREAVINAIAHRDYSKDGAKVQLDVYEDRIVVKSPGGPFPPITIEAMKYFTATPYSRNKKLTFIFNEMDYMEEAGLGMDTFKSIRAEYNLPLPIFDFDGLNVVVTFPRTIEAVKQVGGKSIGKLSAEELKGFEYIRLKEKVKRSEYESEFGFDKKKAERHLGKMVKLRLIKRKGSGPSTFYEIIET